MTRVVAMVEQAVSALCLSPLRKADESDLSLRVFLRVLRFFSLSNINTLRPRSHGTGSVWSPINLKSLKTIMTLEFVIILQNLIKAYHRKSDKSKYDRKLTEPDVETTLIRSRVNGVSAR